MEVPAADARRYRAGAETVMRRSPLRSKRPTPRRKAPERVQQVRTKPKAGAAPTADEKRHMGRIVRLGCLVCSAPATVHHVTSDGFQRIARSHRRTVPLCPRHHQIQHGPHESVEALGHARFTEVYGIDLLATADRLWRESDADSS